jgi:hypothetical protein
MKRHPWLVRGRWKFRRGFGKKPGIPAGRPAVHSADNVSELVTREKLGRIYFGRRDYVDPEMVILNVKALGYEIARLLAERTAFRTVEAAQFLPQIKDLYAIRYRKRLVSLLGSGNDIGASLPSQALGILLRRSGSMERA